MLPILRTGEAIIVGEAVSLPIRTLIDPPDKNRRPDSGYPRVVFATPKEGYEGEGGWAVPRHIEDYTIVMRQWRRQSPHYEHNPPNKRPPPKQWLQKYEFRRRHHDVDCYAAVI